MFNLLPVSACAPASGLAGFAVTLFIECCQLCVGRAFDVDDLLLNTLGAMLGYGLWLLLQKLAPGLAKGFQAGPIS